MIRFTWKAATAKCTTCCSLGQQYVIHFSYARAASPVSPSRTLCSRLLYLSPSLSLSSFSVILSRSFGYHGAFHTGRWIFPRYGDAHRFSRSEIERNGPFELETARLDRRKPIAIMAGYTAENVYRMFPNFTDKP